LWGGAGLEECSAALEANQARLARFQKRKPRAACPGLLPFTPTFNARISPATQLVHRGKTRATKWHQVQINLSCPKYTAVCTATPRDGLHSPSRVMGCCPSLVPPQMEPEAPVCPPVAGASLIERPNERRRDFAAPAHCWGAGKVRRGLAQPSDTP